MAALTLATWLLLAMLLAVVLYRGVFAAAYLLRGRRRAAAAPPHRLQRFAAIVPAHDEELLIGDLIRSIRATRYPQDRIEIHVVADNCSDATVERARALGAHVAERRDPQHPGKGQALSWIFSRLDLTRCDAVAVFDADNLIDPEFFSAMNRELERGARCLQGYDGISNPDESVMTRLLAITYVMKNLLFNAGKAALGLSVPLHGTGMAFRREVIQEHGWQSMSIGEDLEQSLRLVRRGEQIVFVADARIGAQESTTLRQGYAQRQRWATGRRALARAARRAFVDGLRTGSLRLVDVAVDLLIPNYARVLTWSLAALVLALLLRDASPSLLACAAVVLTYQLIEVCVALWLMRAGPRFIASLAFAPVFVVWRIPIDLLAAFGHRQGIWARTARRRHRPSDG